VRTWLLKRGWVALVSELEARYLQNRTVDVRDGFPP